MNWDFLKKSRPLSAWLVAYFVPPPLGSFESHVGHQDQGRTETWNQDQWWPDGEHSPPGINGSLAASSLSVLPFSHLGQGGMQGIAEAASTGSPLARWLHVAPPLEPEELSESSRSLGESLGIHPFACHPCFFRPISWVASQAVCPLASNSSARLASPAATDTSSKASRWEVGTKLPRCPPSIFSPCLLIGLLRLLCRKRSLSAPLICVPGQ